MLSPSGMPETLLNYIQHPLARSTDDQPLLRVATEESQLAEVFVLLRAKFGIDFVHYKPTTVGRRIERRMTINQFENLHQYIDHLKTDPDELNTLYKDLLIGVTQFFRDPEAFQRLEEEIVPNLVNDAGEDGLRIWVPGCATGEEAYSLAILFHEYVESKSQNVEVKVFATDVHKDSLDRAGAGVYGEGSLTDMRPDRLERYFTPKDGYYHLATELRKMVIFAPHNIVSDPPFTRIDLVSCRNLLIYLRPAAQHKSLSLLHFALKTGGILFQGPSESVGELEDEFEDEFEEVGR